MTNKSNLKPIQTIANRYRIDNQYIENYGNYKAKINDFQSSNSGQLVLVTAINPTPAGEGKTTTVVGLNEALNQLGILSTVALREPSLGPVFGRKGGATGGGLSQVVPIDDINLHFNGDFYAIATANNLIAATIDNHIYWGNQFQFKKILWKRCIDMNDRALRNLTIHSNKQFKYQSGFDITAASEIMAIFCLAKNLNDLENRLEKIIVGINQENNPIYLKNLKIVGALLTILQEAFKPNIVQTLEHNLAFIHGGPFANIAHGCNSVRATKLALKTARVVITEAGFGADLGAEKFLNIKCRVAQIQPQVIILVATLRALKMQGGQSLSEITSLNLVALKKGLALLDFHYQNLIKFNLQCIVTLNQFENDHSKEENLFKEWCKKRNILFAFSQAFLKGGKGGIKLAKLVQQCLNSSKTKKLNYTYDVKASIKVKITQIAKKIYQTDKVAYSEKAEEMIAFLEEKKLDKQYICMAKTPNSITDNPKIIGIPNDWTLHVNEIELANGAELIIVKTGNIMTMPGLPKKPQAEKMNMSNQLTERTN